MQRLISIKGNKGELVVRVNDTKDFATIFAHFSQKLDSSRDFFKGSVIHFEWGERSLKDKERSQIAELVAAHDILWEQDQDSNVPFPPEKEHKEPTKASDLSHCLFLHKNIRAGQTIEHKGHIIIFGNVHAGAEVVAGGNVFIWGALQGIVHAGAYGFSDATIAALVLDPAQLRINSIIAINPQQTQRGIKKRVFPEQARLVNEEIVVEAWEEGS